MVIELLVVRRTMSEVGVDLGKGLVGTTVERRRVRVVHAVAVRMIVRTGSQMNVNDPGSAVGLVQKSLENAREIVTSLQLVLQRVGMLSHVSMDNLLLIADSFLNLLLLGLKLTEELDLVLDGSALVKETLWKVIQADRGKPEVGGWIAPVLAAEGLG